MQDSKSNNVSSHGAGRRFYLTTAISYPNGPPHIGHAYESIVTDALARFHRIDGWDVHLVTGTDEHGLKMSQTAERQGLSPQQLADSNSSLFVNMARHFNVSYNDFIRTTEARHHRGAQALWRAMHENGDLYKGEYAGWYSVRDEAYYQPEELSKDENGTMLSPNGTEVEWVKEPSWFFRLSDFGDRLLEHYRAHPDFVGPSERFNEVIRFVERGLNDLSVSRTTLKWGIPVPDDQHHVMYVWVDALTSYASAVGLGSDVDTVADGLWPADLHVIGKDITRFHAVYWPAFLMSAGLPLPKRIFAHGFLFNRGEKMSKSVGNVVDPHALADVFGVDAMRYFFIREVPFGRDGSYSTQAMTARINADLANDLGNLAQRTLSMIQRYFQGKVPQCGRLVDEDIAELEGIRQMVEQVRQAMTVPAPHLMLTHIWERIASANRYIAHMQPWALNKTDPDRAASVLYVGAELLRCFGIITSPIMPTTCSDLLDLLGIAEDRRTIADIDAGLVSVDGDLGQGAISSGSLLPPPKVLFPKIDLQEIEE